MSSRFEESMSANADKMTDAARAGAAAAGQHADDAIHAAADMLENGKESLRDKARHAGEAANRAGRGVAKVMNESVDYFRGSDASDMLEDVRSLTKKHPGAALVTFAVIGFFLGRSLKKAD